MTIRNVELIYLKEKERFSFFKRNGSYVGMQIEKLRCTLGNISTARESNDEEPQCPHGFSTSGVHLPVPGRGITIHRVCH